MYVKSVETAKVFPTITDNSSMGYYSTVEVATRIGITPRRVRQIAVDHAIGRLVGHSRIFGEDDIARIIWYTRKGGGVPTKRIRGEDGRYIKV